MDNDLLNESIEQLRDWWDGGRLFHEALIVKIGHSRGFLEEAVYNKEFSDASRWMGYVEALREISSGEIIQEIIDEMKERAAK